MSKKANNTGSNLSRRKYLNLDYFSGKPVRFKFYLTKTKIYAFWVSENKNGASGGATAAGGPGISGYWNI